MLETILKLYTMAMATDARSPLPHLFGPPGCGKSTSVEQAAELLGVNLHIINVSRISPLDLEGVQMPVTEAGEAMKLRLLHATFWTQLNEGDIVMFDEFLRGFPEVYNGLLDILTSRQVGGLRLPRVFFMAASNSTTSYDKALEDRLLHLPVDDPRKKKSVRRNMGQLIVDALGLMPELVKSAEMEHLLDSEVLPMFSVLDNLGRGPSGNSSNGRSIRNLIGQAQLRQVQSTPLRELLDENNRRAISKGMFQHVFLVEGKGVNPAYLSRARKLVGNDKLTEIQALNLRLNLQLIELEETKQAEKENIYVEPDEYEADPFA